MRDTAVARPYVIPVFMLCLGLFATLAQVTFTREMLVAFFGNELCIGIILAGWLVGITLGAAAAGFFMRKRHVSDSSSLLGALALAAGAFLPFQVLAIRAARLIFDVPCGEYAPFSVLVVSALFVQLPASGVIGFMFPVACDHVEKGDQAVAGASRVAKLYALESVGSVAGGILITFVLLPYLTSSAIALLCAAGMFAASALVLRRRLLPVCLAVIALAACFCAGPDSPIERGAESLRWRAFGFVDEKAAVPTRIIKTADTVYQNLAALESAGQYSVFANGQFLFAFPDPFTYEQSVHFAMAQNPDAKRVLVLGGNPLGDIPELLKYPVEKVVFVDLDPGIGRLLRGITNEYDELEGNPRVQFTASDAPGFVRECRETFDAILVSAPDPVTVAANRFHTREFFSGLKRILAQGGFVHTSVASSERLQGGTLDVTGSIYNSLMAVFPVVLVTAESRNQFFAGRKDSRLTLDRQELKARSESAGLTNRYFRPEYFLGADEIAPDKVKALESRLTVSGAPENRNLRPVTSFYNMLVWSNIEGDGMGRVMGLFARLDHHRAGMWIVGLALAVLCISVVLKLRGATGGYPGTCCSSLSTRVLLVMLGTTGLFGMAAELLLVFVFQSLYGYVYAKIGFIFALFMAGLAVGAPCGEAVARRGGRSPWLVLGAVEAAFLVLVFWIPEMPGLISVSGENEWSFPLGEAMVYFAVVATGFGVGAEFTVVNRLLMASGRSAGMSVAGADAWDSIGAAVGAVLVGAFLTPVCGIGISCALLAALKTAGLVLVASAALTATQGAS